MSTLHSMRFLAIAAWTALLGASAHAQTSCLATAGNPTGAAVSGTVPATPNSGLVDNGNGTITHTATGLMWKKCPEGRTYSGGNCTGTTGSYTWQAALRRAVSDATAGKSDWRLPTRIELLSIVETACGAPTINVARFPNVGSSDMYWSGSHAGANAPDSVWAVRFNNGSSLIATKDMTARARLVRVDDTNPAMTHDVYRSTSAPTEPAAFSFASQLADPGAIATSSIATMSGLTASRSISITGGEYRINGGAWTSAGGTIANGNTLQLKLVAPNTVPASVSTTVNVNGRTATFLVTTGTPPPDTVPDPFSFVDQTGVLPSTTITSAAITVTGINQPTAISVSGGSYNVNGGAYTSTAGTVNNGDTVTVQHTASASYTTAVNTTLTIGGVSDVFTSTTAALDTTPDAFSFTDQTGVTLSTQFSSNTITVSGINGPANISVTGGEYQIGAGAWTSAAGTVTTSQTVTVRHTSSASYGTAVNTTLTVGGVADTFTTTTYALDTAPDAFTFTDQTNVALSTLTASNTITVSGINGPANISVTGGEYQIGAGAWTSAAGTVTNGQTVTVRHTASASFSTAVNTTLTIGGVSDTFTTTTLAADTTPDAFTFTDQTGVPRSSLRTSNAITVAGINTTASISVTGGTYSINGGAYTGTAGTVSNGNTVTVQHTASASYATATDTTLTIGGVSDIFTSTTEPAPGDSTPNAFSFTDQNPVALSTTVTSNTITITGIDTASPISITGGEYQINGGAWTSSPSSVTVNQTVAVRHTSSANELTATNTTLTIGGVSDIFTSTTGDKTPAAFTFTDQTNVALSTLTESNAITVSGITIASDISVAGGEYQIGAGAWTSTAGTVTNGQTVKVRHTSSASFSTATNTALTIGGITDTFTTTTLAADTTPDAFAFTDQTGVALSTLIESNAITVAGINTAASISVTGGEYQIGAGAWASIAGTVTNGQTVKVRHTSSASQGAATNTTLTIGGVSDIFTTTTLSSDSTPDAFSFTDQTNVAVNTAITSAAITVAGINTGAAITVSGGTYDINGSNNFVSTAGTVNNGNTVRARHTSSTNNSTATDTIITIGGVSDTFTSTTVCGTVQWNAFNYGNTSGSKTANYTRTADTITGICAGSTITISSVATGGRGGTSGRMSYSINGGAFTTASGTINPGDTLTLRFLQENKDDTYVATVTIGGVSNTWQHQCN